MKAATTSAIAAQRSDRPRRIAEDTANSRAPALQKRATASHGVASETSLRREPKAINSGGAQARRSIAYALQRPAGSVIQPSPATSADCAPKASGIHNQRSLEPGKDRGCAACRVM